MAARVSVLLPAFRPTYLTQAIASVLTQGFGDYELLINDDSIGEEVRAIVERFADPRIRYSRTAGGEGGAENSRQLWAMANSDLIKFMFDDDVLLPHALGELVGLVEANPGATFAFGHRDFIDADGRITSEPRVIAPGAIVTLDSQQVSGLLIGGLANRIGEMPNVLINRATGVNLDDMLDYAGFPVGMLADVSFYLTASRRGPAVGIGRTISQYRKHPNQNSSIGYNPAFFRGIIEWELFIRGETALGHLTPEQAVAAAGKLEGGYRNWGEALPELSILAPGLARLGDRIRGGERDLIDDDFRARWDETVEAARLRNAAKPSVLRREG
ncbi:MAG: hypothetical protein DI570_14360 [Phenylobacterium zucineum]|nr:MAG: hypothetical protein DI570_14360 [Phenylobacterium zucineum]